ncbi:MAG: MBL fold metallo-hydrolase [Candidatus Muiribacteriaceae bacterium]
MRLKITYIYHNCFVISDNKLNLIFDHPDTEFMTSSALKALSEAICKGENIYFFSHSHHDHFNHDICRNHTCIMSKDIPDTGIDDDDHIKWLAPGDTHRINSDLIIQEVIQSNDQGVAFLLEWHGRTIYFGGDLAEWDWNDLTPEESEQFIDYFRNIIDRLSEKDIDIAFTNADNRLDNLSGFAKFYNTVKPGILVPMHFFGNTAVFDEIDTVQRIPSSKIFRYTHPGDYFLT